MYAVRSTMLRDIFSKYYILVRFTSGTLCTQTQWEIIMENSEIQAVQGRGRKVIYVTPQIIKRIRVYSNPHESLSITLTTILDHLDKLDPEYKYKCHTEWVDKLIKED